MAEYIEREALQKRLIDADELKRRMIAFTTGTNTNYLVIENIVMMIDQADTVDAVEVGRCRDCKWYQEGKLLAPNKFCFRLKHPKEDRKIGYNYAPDDFCSYGERKEG